MKKRIAICFLASLLCGCNKLEEIIQPKRQVIDGMYVYNISKGSNETDGHMLITHSGLAELDINAVLRPNCYYDFSQSHDNGDINKLYGISWGYHQNDSYRVGWNCYRLNGKVQLFSYWYNAGKNYYKYIGDVPLDSVFNFHVNFLYGEGRIVTRIHTLNYCDTIPFNFSHLNNDLTGYCLFPYFGGTSKAPHSMQIRLSR